MASRELQALDHRIEKQTRYLDLWRQPKEPLLFETLRAIDLIYCHDLFSGNARSSEEPGRKHYRSLQTWGVNKALERLIPDQFQSGPFKLFSSNKIIQGQADDFLFHCGIVEKAEMLRGWLSDDFLSARLQTLDQPQPSGIKHILVLKGDAPLLHAEMARMQRRWLSDLSREMDRAWEDALEKRHQEILPDLEKHVGMLGDWGIRYTTTTEIDRYFDEWGQVYLRRMWSQDLIGLEEKLGGSQFNEYLGLLAAISGRAQKHICFAVLLKHRHPELDWRNLLTTFCPFVEFLEGLAGHLDADRLHIQRLLSSLTLEPGNKAAHLGIAETTWAPVVRSNQDHCILPLYGLEINPFLFLLRDLQAKYPRDWFAIANNREKRWRTELNDAFPGPRWICAERGVPLRDERRVVTDIDALVYDSKKNELGVFQLKWQQPVGIHGRANRSAAKNLVEESNKWIATVRSWLDRYGVPSLLQKIGMTYRPTPKVELFVLGRYNAHFAGRKVADQDATWADWPHFIRAVAETHRFSLGTIARRLRDDAIRIRAEAKGESYFIPLDDMAVLLNPTREPR